MTSSDDPSAAHQPQIWQPAALRARAADRPDGPKPPAALGQPSGPPPSDAAQASDTAAPSDAAQASDTAAPSDAAQASDTAAPSGTAAPSDTREPSDAPAASDTVGPSDDDAASARTAPSSAPGRPARIGRPLAVFDELSVRPARSAFGRVAAHLRGLVGSDAAPGELARAWEQQQAPVSTGRRVWVTGGHGGAGTTTLAVCLAQELQARRLDGVALVDAAPGRVGLADRLLRPPQTDVTTGAGLRHERSRSLLSFAPAADLDAPERLATDLRRVAGMTLTDGGQHLPTSHRQAEAVLVVVECSVRGIGAAGVVVEEAAAGLAPERLLIVLTKPTPTSGMSTVWAMR
ncbi:MAG: hypothetical protein ACRCXL_17205, partial [Dermatophilaceae bacterium]